jgi:hypothetical protein
MWEGRKRERWCGFRAWKGRPGARGRGYTRLLEDPRGCAGEFLNHRNPEELDPASLLRAVFDFAGGPIELDALIRIMAVLWNVRERVREEGHPDDEQWKDPLDVFEDVGADTARSAEEHDLLRSLWKKITDLPPFQRTVLLLNFRHGDRGILELIPMLGIAGPRAIVGTFALPPGRIREIWYDLPLDWNALAQLSGGETKPITLGELVDWLAPPAGWTPAEWELALFTRMVEPLPMEDHAIAALLGTTVDYVRKLRVLARRSLAEWIKRYREGS